MCLSSSVTTIGPPGRQGDERTFWEHLTRRARGLKILATNHDQAIVLPTEGFSLRTVHFRRG